MPVCGVNGCIYDPGESRNMVRHRRSSNCPKCRLFVSSDFNFRFSDYDFGALEATNNGRKICSRCDFSVLDNKVGGDIMRKHFYWIHIQLAHGFCYFCGIQQDSRQNFEQHVSICLRALNQIEIDGWLTAIIG
jgi:hypothetical protein